MKFLVDECLSPSYVARLVLRVYPDAIHPIHVGLLGASDRQIQSRALFEDRIVITANRVDFRRLLAHERLHPGAIIVEALEKELCWRQIVLALGFIELQDRPIEFMVNRIIEVSAKSGVTPYEWPAAA